MLIHKLVQCICRNKNCAKGKRCLHSRWSFIWTDFRRVTWPMMMDAGRRTWRECVFPWRHMKLRHTDEANVGRFNCLLLIPLALTPSYCRFWCNGPYHCSLIAIVCVFSCVQYSGHLQFSQFDISFIDSFSGGKVSFFSVLPCTPGQWVIFEFSHLSVCRLVW